MLNIDSLCCADFDHTNCLESVLAHLFLPVLFHIQWCLVELESVDYYCTGRVSSVVLYKSVSIFFSWITCSLLYAFDY